MCSITELLEMARNMAHLTCLVAPIHSFIYYLQQHWSALIDMKHSPKDSSGHPDSENTPVCLASWNGCLKPWRQVGPAHAKHYRTDRNGPKQVQFDLSRRPNMYSSYLTINHTYNGQIWRTLWWKHTYYDQNIRDVAKSGLLQVRENLEIKEKSGKKKFMSGKSGKSQGNSSPRQGKLKKWWRLAAVPAVMFFFLLNSDLTDI